MRRQFCQCCGRELTGKIRWLELDQRNQTYHDFGNIPPEENQGGFPFGIDCAKRKVAEAVARLSEAS